MASIEELGYPLVYKAHAECNAPVPESAGGIGIRTEVRALKGMQKEALVHYGPSGEVWRMVSDEGPYLNGTDLAPFPLAFYTAGMAFSFLSELLRHAEAHSVSIRSASLVQDHYYTMEGSAIRGDMTGGAKPVELLVRIETDAPSETAAQLVRLAEASSPAQAYMRDRLENTFALCLNGRALPVVRVRQSPATLAADPEPKFDAVRPLPAAEFLPDIITKLKTAETLFGVEGGAGSSLKAEQKRTLHVRGIAKLLDDGRKEVTVQLFKPIGSTFRFVSDERGEVAPPALAYLVAGIGFCYMTQLGRYAHIVKMDLPSYRIVQDSTFHFRGSAEAGTLWATAAPVDTHVFVTSSDPDEAVQRLVSMGEQTCFLHAAMRTSNRSRIEAEINGERVSIHAAR